MPKKVGNSRFYWLSRARWRHPSALITARKSRQKFQLFCVNWSYSRHGTGCARIVSKQCCKPAALNSPRVAGLLQQFQLGGQTRLTPMEQGWTPELLT